MISRLFATATAICALRAIFSTKKNGHGLRSEIAALAPKKNDEDYSSATPSSVQSNGALRT